MYCRNSACFIPQYVQTVWKEQTDKTNAWTVQWVCSSLLAHWGRRSCVLWTAIRNMFLPDICKKLIIIMYKLMSCLKRRFQRNVTNWVLKACNYRINDFSNCSLIEIKKENYHSTLSKPNEMLKSVLNTYVHRYSLDNYEFWNFNSGSYLFTTDTKQIHVSKFYCPSM